MLNSIKICHIYLVIFIEGSGMKEPVTVVTHHFKDENAPKYVQHHPSYRETEIKPGVVLISLAAAMAS